MAARTQRYPRRYPPYPITLIPRVWVIAVVNLDAVIEPIRGLRQRECFEAFAGCGTMADAFRADGGVVAGLLERDPAKLPLLRAAHKDAQLHLDYEDTSWASFAWSAGALRVVLGGPPCQPVAPTGKRLGVGDPRIARPRVSSARRVRRAPSPARRATADALGANTRLRSYY